MKRNILKKFICSLVAATLALSLSLSAFAAGDQPSGHIAMTLERFSVGQGYILEPTLVPFYEGERASQVLDRFFDGNSNYMHSGTLEGGFYLSRYKDNATTTQAGAINPPQFITAAAEMTTAEFVSEGRSIDGWLGEFDYSFWAGWMYSQNNIFPSYGFADCYPQDGDVIRVQFSLYGYGADLGVSSMGSGSEIVNPANKDALIFEIAKLNSAQNKAELLAKPGVTAAYNSAYLLLENIESTQADVDVALGVLQLALGENQEGELPEPIGDKKITLASPSIVSGDIGTEFNLTVRTDTWIDEDAKLIDGIINIPNGLEVTDIVISPQLTGGGIDYNLSDGKLRFTYMSTTLDSLDLSAVSFPAELMSIKLKLSSALPSDSNIVFSTDHFTAKTASDQPAIAFDISQANSSTKVSGGQSGSFSVSSRVLYTGDDSDLIAVNKKAVALEFVGLSGTPDIKLAESDLYYSSEITEKTGSTTYVAIVDSSTSADLLDNSASYSVGSGSALNVKFADTNDDSTVNAQDALNTLSGWLRKTAIDTDKGILTSNVTADERIDTFDVLAIVEYYVDASEFVVVTK